jgi:hypothetical protein
MNKKGMELSINFVILLILAIVTFGYSVQFIYTMFNELSQLEGQTFDQLDKQVEGLTCGSQQVCLGVSRATMVRGAFRVFGLRILNSRNTDTDFKITLEHGLVPEAGEKLYFKPDVREITQLGAGDVQVIGLGVEIPKTARSGNYVLNINVVSKDGAVEVPYGDQEVYKLNVIVP